jgi:hypothetical protein
LIQQLDIFFAGCQALCLKKDSPAAERKFLLFTIPCDVVRIDAASAHHADRRDQEREFLQMRLASVSALAGRGCSSLCGDWRPRTGTRGAGLRRSADVANADPRQ